MTEHCERCGKIPKLPHIINPHNESNGFAGKRTVLCDKCRVLWHMTFALINHGSVLVENLKETRKAWKKFMADRRETVEFT